MTKEECEAKILEKLKEIKEIYKQYNPDGTYLDMVIVDGSIMFWNKHYNDDKELPINYWVKLNKGDKEDE